MAQEKIINLFILHILIKEFLIKKSRITKLALAFGLTHQAYFMSQTYSEISKQRFEDEVKNNPDVDLEYFPRERCFIIPVLKKICEELNL